MTTETTPIHVLREQYNKLLRRGDAILLLEQVGLNKHHLERLVEEQTPGLRRVVSGTRHHYDRDVLLAAVLGAEDAK